MMMRMTADRSAGGFFPYFVTIMTAGIIMTVSPLLYAAGAGNAENFINETSRKLTAIKSLSVKMEQTVTVAGTVHEISARINMKRPGLI